MEDLPHKLKVEIATFLEPSDIFALCLSCEALARLGTDENLFWKLYHRDFVPHLRLFSEVDLNDLFAITRPLHGLDVEKVYATAAEEKLVHALRSNPKPEEKTWKEMYATLYWTKQGMINAIRNTFGLPLPTKAPVHDCGIKTFLVYDTQLPDEVEDPMFFWCGSLGATDLIVSESSFSSDVIAFDPDFTMVDLQVRMQHLDVFHQMRLINKRQEGLSQYRNYREEDPPNGWFFACVFEGICCWNKTSQKYHLIYPMCSLRRLYLQCRDHVLLECRAKMESIQILLSQVTTLKYVINSDDFAIAQRNPTLIQTALTSSLAKFDLKIDTLELEPMIDATNSSSSSVMITLTCSCAPPPKFKDDTCLSERCTNMAALRDPEVNVLWKDKYCEHHYTAVVEDESFSDYFISDMRLRESETRINLLRHFFSKQNTKIADHLCLGIKDILDAVDKEVHLKRTSTCCV
jgi:hypothetical protein